MGRHLDENLKNRLIKLYLQPLKDLYLRSSTDPFTAGDFVQPILLLGMIFIVLFVGLVSGSYPAVFLSSFRPVNILRGRERTGGKSGLLRKILVVGQFAVSTGFIIGVIIILQQMKFMRNTDLGFNKKNVAVITA